MHREGVNIAAARKGNFFKTAIDIIAPIVYNIYIGVVCLNREVAAMQINRDTVLQDAKRLKQSAASTANPENRTKPGATDTGSNVRSSLDSINVDLRTHQQNTAKLQIESLGLSQIRSSIDAVLARPETSGSTSEQIETAIDATRFQKELLIPENIRSMLREAAGNPQTLQTILPGIENRQQEVAGLLEHELSHISKLAVSLENIVSLNAGSEIQSLANGIREQLSTQQQIQSAMDPRTVMSLLEHS